MMKTKNNQLKQRKTKTKRTWSEPSKPGLITKLITHKIIDPGSIKKLNSQLI
jgi:hypothetical protein